MEWQLNCVKVIQYPLLCSYLNHNENNECITKGWNLCFKLKDCHCQASFEKTGTPVGTQQFQACVKLALLGKGP